MKRIFHFVKDTYLEALVPIAFFFIVFNLLVITRTLILEAHAVTFPDVATATVGAFIVAKAVVISEKLPFINMFRGRPLVFSVVWKTAIYWVLCFVFRGIEQMMPFLLKHEGIAAAARHLVREVSWPQFWALQMWLIVALIFYNSVKELDKCFGEGSVRNAFLGMGPANK